MDIDNAQEHAKDYTERGAKLVLSAVKNGKKRKISFIVGEGRTKKVEITKNAQDD